MAELNLIKVELDWCIDILTRIKEIHERPTMSDPDKLESIGWLVKQALKVERED